ncbi:MAG TPA: four helix bundle protein [Cytophagales bacterium]|nr:four helix bundle protein [Cytophagales bacterium]
MSEVASFKDLLLWQKGILIVKRTYNISNALPMEEQYGLVNQMRRSSTSIPAGVAEGWGRKSTKTYVQHIRIALRSLFELHTHLVVANEWGFITEDEIVSIEKQINEEGKMIQTLIEK